MKFFMVSGAFEASAAEMAEAIRIADHHGMLPPIHCEDGTLIQFAGARLLASSRGHLAAWPTGRRAGRSPPSGRPSSGHRFAAPGTGRGGS